MSLSFKEHNPVLLQEVIENMNLQSKKQIFVDGTLGLGGYTKMLLENTNNDTKVIAFELDQDNLKFAKKRLAEFRDRIIFVHSNFDTLEENLEKLGFQEIDGIMLDLGLSSPQVDDAEKGFSFLREGQLDMRFDQRVNLTASKVVNTYSEEKLKQIFKDFGEEPQSGKIAAKIVERRRAEPFLTTSDLADFVARVKHSKFSKKKAHPATLVFQAIRIEVNHELDALLKVLNQAVNCLKAGGRIVVVSYHSLEDRIVKTFFKDQSREYINLPDELTTTKLNPKIKIITKKPITPSEKEIEINPRSRSAKLRVAEKI
ncbi:16S rRNA (cytosine(1402)-N(4))-methyltransferase RsmH [Candidatus Peregrinibacteria bacterium]|nr:16S rRNA (cytosine(1402)-N(4))-methyltransferase RsmH [Candidatus Peregrinibacteria bacterium]